ncbi:MAG: hypothetical protein ACK4IB_07425 [Erythrobacter sp.]
MIGSNRQCQLCALISLNPACQLLAEKRAKNSVSLIGRIWDLAVIQSRIPDRPVPPKLVLLINLALLISFVIAEPISGAIMAGMIAICIGVWFMKRKSLGRAR